MRFWQWYLGLGWLLLFAMALMDDKPHKPSEAIFGIITVPIFWPVYLFLWMIK